jgi:hypothetical protein
VRQLHGVPPGIPLAPVLPQPQDYDWGALWRAASPDDGLGPWITSRWGGYCRGCGHRFEPGDLIRYYAGEDSYLAECCGVSPDG